MTNFVLLRYRRETTSLSFEHVCSNVTVIYTTRGDQKVLQLGYKKLIYYITYAVIFLTYSHATSITDDADHVHRDFGDPTSIHMPHVNTLGNCLFNANSRNV